MEVEAIFDPAALGLKEIGNLASWTVSSCKPGCGVDALRDDDTTLFWQWVFFLSCILLKY
jgi:anaphase-promoting complex subunit 10